MVTAITEHLFSFRGRITRRAFWLRYVLPAFGVWVLVNALLPIDVQFIKPEAERALANGDISPFNPLTVLTTFGIIYAVGCNVLFVWVGAVARVKRLHDLGRPGWMALIALVPMIGLPLFFVYLGFFPGTKGTNRFGPNPRSSRHSDHSESLGAA
jgi:uncharacterized membrane protein YhaH (DUF805 family)